MIDDRINHDEKKQATDTATATTRAHAHDEISNLDGAHSYSVVSVNTAPETARSLQRLMDHYTNLLSRTIANAQASLIRVVQDILRTAIDARLPIQHLLELLMAMPPARWSLDNNRDEDSDNDDQGTYRVQSSRRKPYKRPATTTASSPRQVNGVANMGNTCFLNATLQALASIDSFLDYLQEIVTKHHPATVSESLLVLLDSINGHDTKLDPRGILHQVAMKHGQFVNEYEQQDAEEFLQSIMSIVTDEWQVVHNHSVSLASMLLLQLDHDSDSDDDEIQEDDKSAKTATEQAIPTTEASVDKESAEERKQEDLARQHQSKTSFPNNPIYQYSRMTPSPLHGWQGSPLQCCVCHHVRPIQNEPFLDIPIVPTAVSTYLSDVQHSRQYPGAPIKAMQASPCSLLQCLRNYTSVERVQHVECHTCTRQREIAYWEDEVYMLRGVVKTLSSRKNQEDELQVSQEELTKAEHLLTYLNSISEDADIPMVRDSSIEEDDIQKVRGDALKCMLLTRLPRVLCIHVQRRFLDPHKNLMTKTLQHVEFTEFMDMSSLCVYGNNHHAASFAGTNNNKSPQVTPHTPMPYKLKSVIEHRGNANSGHYQCYRRDITGEGWLFVSDDNVQAIDWKHVQHCEAYMLFYEAVL
jgi:ubiquitin C-terminal hydrolase